MGDNCAWWLEISGFEWLKYGNDKNMKKTSFKKLIKPKINQKTFENLKCLKMSHSKVKNLEHCDIIMQKYLYSLFFILYNEISNT